MMSHSITQSQRTCATRRIWFKEHTAILLIALGSALRLACALFTDSSRDAVLWYEFGTSILERGLAATYAAHEQFNHPPLISYFVSGLASVARAFGIPFVIVIRLFSAVADICTGALLFIARRRETGERSAGLEIWALYSIALNPILISGIHGNTDSVCLAFVVLATVLMQHFDRPFLAGLVLGAALNVKLIPVLVVPLLISCLGTRPQGNRPAGLSVFNIGLSVAMLPLLICYATVGNDFLNKVLLYRPKFHLLWGPLMLLNGWSIGTEITATSLLSMFPVAPILLGCVCVLGAVNWLYPRYSPLHITGLGLLIFTVVTPTFATQYLIFVCPFLLYVNRGLGSAYAAISGLLLVDIYFGVDRLLGFHESDPLAVLLSGAAWALCIVALYTLLKNSTKNSAKP